MLQRRKGIASQKVGQHAGERAKADRVSAYERSEPEILSERRLSETTLASDKDVLTAFDEVRRMKPRASPRPARG